MRRIVTISHPDSSPANEPLAKSQTLRVSVLRPTSVCVIDAESLGRGCGHLGGIISTSIPAMCLSAPWMVTRCLPWPSSVLTGAYGQVMFYVWCFVNRYSYDLSCLYCYPAPCEAVSISAGWACYRTVKDRVGVGGLCSLSDTMVPSVGIWTSLNVFTYLLVPFDCK